MLNDSNNDDNFDDILAESTTDIQDSINNKTEIIHHLNYLQNLLETSINPKEFEEHGRSYIEYLISTVKKTVRQEDSLIRQFLYTAFSAYSKDPINLGIMAPTSEGKSFVAIETLQYFPKEDVWKIGSITPKVIIRQNGILVDNNNQPVEDKIKDLKNQINKEKDEDIKEKLKGQLSELLKDTKILIDLSNKIFLFLEPPHSETWNILKPILSHDLYEMEHPYVFDVEGFGFKVKKIVTRGWPCCIFCSAKDESKWPVWPEIQSRFLITSPNMIKQKYEESNLLIARRKGLPKSIQQKIIISDKDKEIAKTCVLYLKEKIKNTAILLPTYSSITPKQQYNYDSVSVWIPYAEILASALPSDKGTDVRIAKRIFSFLELLPLIKSESRFKIVYGSELLIVAAIEDLAEVLYITQDLKGIPPYKMQFFKNVFIPLFKSKDKPNEKEDKIEDRIAVTSKELAEYCKLKEGKSMTESNIRKNYLADFLLNGLIDEDNSVIDARCKIYFLLVEIHYSIAEEENKEEKYENYRNLSHSHNLFQYCKITTSKNYINIDKKWLNFEILSLIKYGNDTDNFQFAILDYETNDKICICQFEKKYEESKYGPLILLFSNAQYCNSYNKIFGTIRNIGIIPKEIYEKLREWPEFPQYSYFDYDKDNIKEDEENQESGNSNTNPIEKTDTDSNFLSNTYDTSKDKIDIDGEDNNGNNETSVSASISDTSKIISNDLVNLEDNETTNHHVYCDERLFESLKPHPLIGYREPFYYCKEHPKIQNINYESILLHLMHSKDHKSK